MNGFSSEAFDTQVMQLLERGSENEQRQIQYLTLLIQTNIKMAMAHPSVIKEHGDKHLKRIVQKQKYFIEKYYVKYTEQLEKLGLTGKGAETEDEEKPEEAGAKELYENGTEKK